MGREERRMREIIVRQDGAVCELIRCKDCKYWYQDFEGKCIVSTPYGTDTDEDDFCSFAERKDNG